MFRVLAIVSATLLGSSALADDPSEGLPDHLITLWAENAIPLAEFVQAGYGLSVSSDATSSEWCAYQPNTIGLLYANAASCRDMLNRMRELGRIE